MADPQACEKSITQGTISTMGFNTKVCLFSFAIVKVQNMTTVGMGGGSSSAICSVKFKKKKESILQVFEKACQYTLLSSQVRQTSSRFLKLEKISLTQCNREMTHGSCTEKQINVNQTLQVNSSQILSADHIQQSFHNLPVTIIYVEAETCLLSNKT